MLQQFEELSIHWDNINSLLDQHFNLHEFKHELFTDAELEALNISLLHAIDRHCAELS